MTRNGVSRKEHSEKEPIAIIGIGCRYPGGVKDPQTFWQLLANGVDAISDIPADRVDVAPLYDPLTGAPGRIASSQGGFLDKLDQFDASFFGVSPREAEYMDPQQRLLLETSWEALEDAGQVPKNLKESQTGVFVGMWTNDYTEKMYKAIEDINLYVTTGGGRYAASGRLSYFFGLQGPSLTVDTACSSSLVTVHLACQSLREGESDLALAGGVNLILEPAVSIGYSRSKMLSPDGRCKFGDVSANGYVRSEGAGMIVLKRLSDAKADNDHIYAIIRGSAVNNDGRSSELLVAPGVGSQVKMLREAYGNAGIDPAQVGYVEAHGTGTPVGDPVELEALGTVLSENRDASRACRIGSIKTNIGHTESASGVAGLIKVALSLEHKSIPPSLHFKNPNPKIPWKDLKLEMQTELTGWPDSSSPRIASVNSFGVTGTNAHVVLEEAPQVGSKRSTDTFDSIYLLPLSAQTPEALKSLIESYLAVLSKDCSYPLHDISYTVSCRRAHHAQRLVMMGRTTQEWVEQLSLSLQQIQSDSPSRTQIAEHAKVAFVFPGQGAQWLGMGRELLKQNLAFRERLTLCDQAIKRWADWSLLEQLSLGEDSPSYRLNEISVIQPALFAIEIALAEVWRSWGIEPSAVIGHSMGEVAAAYVAGALSLDNAARIICKRSQLMQRTSGQGAMAVIGMPFKEVETSLQGYEGRLSVAVQNSPKSTVVAGDPDALELFMDTMQSRDVFCRLIKVDVASHSPQMDPIRSELVDLLQSIQPQAAAIPFYSTVTQDICAGELLDADYWGRNLRQPVRFSETVQKLLEDEHVIFIEMSPHPILLSSIEETRTAIERTAYGFASLRRDQPELATMLGEVGSLYVLGYDMDWSKFYPDGEIVSLPTYPWQRERYWFETTASSKQTRPGAHPLLGKYIHSATGEHIWETAISTKLFPYLNDHQVRGSVVLPAAAYVELALAAASEISGSKSYRIKDISFREALFLSNDEEKTFQLVLTSDTPDPADFRVYSQTSESDPWSLHASGTIEFVDKVPSGTSSDWKDLRSQPMEIAADEFYSHTSQRGLGYGPNFQSIMGVTQQQIGILSKIKLSAELIPQMAKYLLHPVLLDACFQTLLAALPLADQDTYLPTSLETIERYTAPSFAHEFWCYMVPTVDRDHVTGDIYLFDENEQMILSAHQLQLQRVEAEQRDVWDLLYEIQWQESPIPAPGQSEQKHWLIFADQQGVGKALAEKLRQNAQTYTLVLAGREYQSDDANRFELDPSKPAQFQQLLKDINQPVHNIVHLWSLDQASTPSISDSNVPRILYLMQAIAQISTTAPHLYLVTRGTQSVLAKPEPVSVSQAPVWGMGAVIANEFPNMHCTRVDLSPVAMEGEIDLLSQVLQAQDEDQVALRNRQRYAARLKRVTAPAANDAQSSVRQKVESHRSFQVDVVTPGILDSLSLNPVLRRSPGTGEVEIAVKATGLNFMNVMSAMGICPGYSRGVGPLGIECAGVIVNVGESVTDFNLGDEVAAIASDSLASHAITDARLVVKKPASLSFEEAASIPIAYVTVYYALQYLGRLQANERVLIHSATGGVGLAAIQLAKRAGAEIFATAGSAEKRDYLKSLGIQHVMDSRSLSFADDIMKITHGEGVDVVLNSLAGNAITKGLQVLKPYGRFLEIGKRDIYQNSKIGLLPFQKNLSYFAIDLDKASHERPDLIGGMLREIFELIELQQFTALPLQVFPVSEVSDGFRMMAQARHIGKIAITMEDPNASFDVPAGAMPICADGTYLITGGLGDLGLTFARWLARQGACHLVLLGRSKPSESAQQVIDELRDAGINVTTAQVDVTYLSQLSAVFAQIKQDLPPLQGVIHAAGLLADATIPQMDYERFMHAYAPKTLGAWNLHTLTADQPLDFFILFSSVAAVLGTPGQVNYAAGNTFLDGLARFRRSQNLPALSINWGPWGEIGLAAEQANRGERLTQQGLKSLTPGQGLDAMSLLMAQKNPQVCVMWLDSGKWCMAQPAAAHSSLFKDLLNQIVVTTTEKKSADKNIREEMLAADSSMDRRTLFETYLREQVAQVLHLAPARIALDKPLRTLGLDSLMSIELRNRLEDGLHIPLSASLIWNYPTIHALTTYLAEKIEISFEKDEPSAVANSQKEVQHVPDAEIENLSKAELDALLKEELDAIEDLLGDK